MSAVYILEAIRTPLGRHGGALARVRPDDLAAHVIGAVLDRVLSARESLSEVVFGATNQSGEDNRNVARMALLLSGLPYEVSGVTVNRLCGSGLEAVIQASRAIRLGEHEVMIAGGVESMTRAPYVMAKNDRPFPQKTPEIYDSSLGWRFPNPKMAERFPLESMGETAENVAARYGVSREDQDRFALESHRKAASAWSTGTFDAEVVPVTVPAAGKQAQQTVERDEGVRSDTSLEQLARLLPVFREGGTVTAGNSSPLNDGAAAVLLASEPWVNAHGAKPLAKIIASASVGVDPRFMGIGPVPATRKLLERAGLDVQRIGLVELNEAFAAQSLACIRELGLDPSIVNVHGGAIALGHPIGCSGARIIATLVHAMKDRTNVRHALATLCIGVGQGLALLLERMET